MILITLAKLSTVAHFTFSFCCQKAINRARRFFISRIRSSLESYPRNRCRKRKFMNEMVAGKCNFFNRNDRINSHLCFFLLLVVSYVVGFSSDRKNYNKFEIYPMVARALWESLPKFSALYAWLPLQRLLMGITVNAQKDPKIDTVFFLFCFT